MFYSELVSSFLGESISNAGDDEEFPSLFNIVPLAKVSEIIREIPPSEGFAFEKIPNKALGSS